MANLDSSTSPDERLPGAEKSDNNGIGTSIIQSTCLNLLVEGHVQSFSEFFLLTHSSSSSSVRLPSTDPDKPRSAIFVECGVVEDEETKRELEKEELRKERNGDSEVTTGGKYFTAETLTSFKQLLTETEDSIRSGIPKSIYEAKTNLGDRFASLNDLKTAIGHYRDALRMSKKLKDGHAAQIAANLCLGSALEQQGNLTEALENYEQSRKHSKSDQKSSEEQKATKCIVSVRVKIAEQLENSGDVTGAVDHYMNCLEIIKNSCPDDMTAMQDINYRIGKAQQRIGNIDLAVEYLQAFAENCHALNNMEKEGMAQAALASCFESSGDTFSAIGHLTKLLSLSEKYGIGKKERAQACNRLGVIYNKIGEYSLAIEFFEKHFAILSGDERPEGEEGSETTEQGEEDGREDVENEIEKGEEEEEEGGDEDEKEKDPSARREDGPLAFEAKEGYTDVAAAQVQLGIARANAELERFLGYVKYETAGNLAALLHWKTYHEFAVEQTAY